MGSPTPKRIFRCLSVVVTLWAGATAGAERYAAEIRTFEKFVKNQMEADRIPGLTIGFIKDDFQWVEGFGYADLENRVPATAVSAYRLASVTKPMTAIGVLILAKRGQVDLDAEVQRYVPYFPKKTWPVTVRQLLGHLGGISHYRDYDKEGHFKEHKDTREAIAVFEAFDLVAEPGTKFNYSSYGYNLLGAVIEGASGRSYGEFMREFLWGPLGMSDTRMDDPDAIIPNRVRGYRPGPKGEIINSEFVDISSRFAAGGTRSTVIDLLKFARGLSRGDVLGGTYIDSMFTPMVTRDGQETGYGMGWSVTPVNGRFAVSHSGGQAETRTYLVWFPEAKLAIAAACNFEGASRAPYVERLYQLVMSEAWNPRAYTGSRETDAIHEVMWETFNGGASYVDRHGGPRSRDAARLGEAFTYLNACVDQSALAADFEGVRSKIAEGRHPSAGRPFALVGSHMAAELRERYGPDTMKRVHAEGAIPFFHAYIELYKAAGGDVRGPRFDGKFETLVGAWHADWRKTWTPYTRGLAFTGTTNFDDVAAKLRKTFSGARVYPDLVGGFSRVSQSFFASGKMGEAARIAALATELYPRSPDALVLDGITRLGIGEIEAAYERIRSAKEIDARGPASPGALNFYAYQLKELGRLETGLELLTIATRLYPKEANLYDSAGEFYLDKGDTANAIASYKKALEIDPDFENAKRMLEKLRD